MKNIEVLMVDTSELRKTSTAVFIAIEENIAKDLSIKLLNAANEIDRLRIELSIVKHTTKYTNEQLQNMTLKEAQIELSNNLYEASSLIELLEYVSNKSDFKRLLGNGHNIRQKIAKFGSEILKDRWTI